MMLWRFVFLSAICTVAAAQTGPTKLSKWYEESARYVAAKDLMDLQKNGVPPEIVSRPVPEYPINLRAEGIGGKVIIAFVVDTDGTVPEAYIIRSTNPAFERPALDAVKQFKFHPGTLGGEAVSVRMQVPVEFSLDGGWLARPAVPSKNNPRPSNNTKWDEPPRPVITKNPVYPFPRLSAGVSGVVMCNVLVEPDGNVGGIDPVSATENDFAEATRAALWGWRFTPAKAAGRSVSAWLLMLIPFGPEERSLACPAESGRRILKQLGGEPRAFVEESELDAPLRGLPWHRAIFPPELRKKHHEGNALIEYFVDEKGDAQLPRIVSSSHEKFGYAAAQSVASWRFIPPTKNGKPVIVRVQTSVKFSLKEEKP
jgi:TonB family protein